MSLTEYQHKRDFKVTTEPAGKQPAAKGWLYVIQKHAASHLHYDFRLQLGDVLKSWAVPKGPSLDPSTKRLAMKVEDHPVAYGDFEGTIPAGEYGGGTVMLWDRGTWTPLEDPEQGHRKGRLKFELHGEKLTGAWMLVRKGGTKDVDERHWFLIKERDASASDTEDIVESLPDSVTTHRTLDEIAAAQDRQWTGKKSATRQSNARAKTAKPKPKQPRSTHIRAELKTLTGAKRSKQPDFIAPQLATLVDQAPDGDQWLHEIKLDGYRMQCHIASGKAQFISRNQQDWTDKFPELAKIAAELTPQNVILDGEVVAVDQQGVSQFQLLQNAFKQRTTDTLHYYVFDILYLNGYDLRPVALVERKRLLAELLQSATEQKHILLSEHVVGNGPSFFEEARKLKLEGIISKLAERPYLSGRSGEWLKTKTSHREEFVIGGYTDPGGSRAGFGALLLGYHQNGNKLVYAGKVGTGFSHETIANLMSRLMRLDAERSPFTDLNGKTGEARHAHWVRPELVAQIEFSNWTQDGRLRHPAFLGLREDKPAKEVVREAAKEVKQVNPTSAVPARSRTKSKTRERMPAADNQTTEIAGVRLSHPAKVLYADQGITKLELAEYYVAIEKWILPHVSGRLLVLVRCPKGAGKECFYQKHPGRGTFEGLRQIPVREKNSTENYVVLDDLQGLVTLVQLGVLEIHIWGSRADDFERPDRLIFDLDPDPSVEWPQVIECAQQIRQFFTDLGMTTFLKTTGGKGLHLVLPIQRRHDWDEVKQFCHAVATSIVTADPARYTDNMSKAARKGKIYIDYLRNQRGATSVAPYSTRSRPGAPVSVPIAWEELSTAMRSDHFTIRNLPERLARLKQDPWKDIYKIRQSITVSAKRLVGL